MTPLTPSVELCNLGRVGGRQPAVKCRWIYILYKEGNHKMQKNFYCSLHLLSSLSVYFARFFCLDKVMLSLVQNSTNKAVSWEQSGVKYTKNKPFGRLCKMCDPFFYDFRLVPVVSVNVFMFVCCYATCYTCSLTAFTYICKFMYPP